jgi:hypothetical protein
VTTDTTLALGAAQQPRGPFDVPAYGFLRTSSSRSRVGRHPRRGRPVAGLPVQHPPEHRSDRRERRADLRPARRVRAPGRTSTGRVRLPLAIRASAGLRRHHQLQVRAPHPDRDQPSQRLRVAREPERGGGVQAVLDVRTRPRQAYSTAPTTPASVQVKAWLESWSQPNATDLTGRPQMREPIGHGTTQFWSAFTKAGLAIGNQTILLPRVGNLVRGLIFIARDGTGARNDGVSPIRFRSRGMPASSARVAVLPPFSGRPRHLPNGAARDTGVFSIMFNDSTTATRATRTRTCGSPRFRPPAWKSMAPTRSPGRSRSSPTTLPPSRSARTSGSWRRAPPGSTPTSARRSRPRSTTWTPTARRA